MKNAIRSIWRKDQRLSSGRMGKERVGLEQCRDGSETPGTRSVPIRQDDRYGVQRHVEQTARDCSFF